MAHYKFFEDLEVWKRARIICEDVYDINHSGDLQKDYGLWNQINKSTGSAMDNITEGFNRNGNREFIQFLSIAKASCAESKSQLYRCLDRNYIEQNQFDLLHKKMDECKVQIAGFMKYFKNSDRKGNKYE